VPLDLYVYYTYIEFVSQSSDPEKNAANIAKHGVSLTDGDGALLDPLAYDRRRFSQNEPRRVTIGMNSFGSVMVVVWTERTGDTRLITVRRAEPKERRTYEEGI
jgi:uncharacterized DUF497 family protein